MNSQIANNKRIAKNAVYMYLRMFITMGVGLFTSRVILNVLGIEDFGVYNIVGGIVILFSFISVSLRNATERFISFELGIGDKKQIQKVISVCIQCHILIIVILFALTETLGLWILYNYINVPNSRINVAEIVYQLSILTFFINILQVPFQSIVISYERMSFYAYLSILEVILKLLIVYFLYLSTFDKLIMYSLFMTVISFIILISYIFYCKRVFKLGFVKFEKDIVLFKEVFKFTSYSMVNGGASVISVQVGNILLNMFFGVVINAAVGIANQVSGHVYAFVSNVQSAFQPQIVKLYAIKEFDKLNILLSRTSLASFYLILIISTPIFLETQYLLSLWLVDVPDYTSVFCKLLLLSSLIDAFQAPLWMLIYGTGKIKEYTFVTSIIVMINIPLTWMFLNNGLPPYWFFISRIITMLACTIYRVLYVKGLRGFYFHYYISGVMIRPILVCLPLCFYAYFVREQPFIYIHPLINMMLSFIFVVFCVLLFGFNKRDKMAIIQIIKTYFYRVVCQLLPSK